MITDDMLVAAIEDMLNNFDSHQVILQVAHDNQHAYILALYEKVAAGVSVPFQALHSSLGTRIKQICDGGGYHFTQPDEHQSNDIFGQLSHCAAYRKVV
jgi:hypothetical protein